MTATTPVGRQGTTRGRAGTLLLHTRAALAAALQALRSDGRSIALVPTMGALHEGHRSLLRQAREHCDAVVATVFVNPLQFAPGEDLDRYPRTLDADVAACADEGVDLVWAPQPSEVYRGTPAVTVTAGAMGEVLCGAHRPGHFDGVLTVVCKLLHLVAPDVAVFGEKDAQQLVLIRRMVDDLDLPVVVYSGATVREPDGLALSSRNRYLSPAERSTALALSRALDAGRAVAAEGASPAAVLQAARDVLAAARADGLELEYCELVDPSTLSAAPLAGPHALLAIAARVGTTRLIDNTTLDLGVGTTGAKGR